ncbi:probable peptidyl-glycine alpha-amidating monooxygenase pamn-1 [Ruditapes philippinarum]|uniref:probable peptidyl-glycine alpha-amidating monooxygenase pamn-1 n=1 Tax=Ruditapes philippinarum TaxID=129788 RepID=UPI00295C0195|nr:probable peptidyl-glycine alpha-amidating monooxygenase pamn-1 [Ruditapes philippinarum]
MYISNSCLCIYRILCYTAGLNGTKEGEFIKRYEPQRGTIYAIEFDSSGKLFAVNGPGFPVTEGFTLDTMGNIEEFWGPTNNGFPGQPHDVTVSRDGSNVFVGDIEGSPKLWRFSSTEVPVKTVGK